MTNKNGKIITSLFAVVATVGLTVSTAPKAEARDHIKIVGSSTVYPYATKVAEKFANKTGKETPVLESTGTGGGMKLFCNGLGASTPDVTNASRAIKSSELRKCFNNGVRNITEVLVGYDGLSIANHKSAHKFNLSKKDLFLALAKEVPVDGKMVPNPNKYWSDVNPSLPRQKIVVYGPPPTSGTRDAFVELAMHEGCKDLDYFKEQKKVLGKKDFKKLIKTSCSQMRTDGAFIEAGENDNLIVKKLSANKQALGIFGYAFLFENKDSVQAVTIDRIEPSMDTIADGSYSISRPLYFYVKNDHRGVIPGLDEYVKEFVSESAMNKEDGYLLDKGLVPLAPEKLREIRETIANKRNNVSLQP